MTRRAVLSRLLHALPVASTVVVWLLWVDDIRRSDLLVFLRAGRDVAAGTNPYTEHTDPFLWGGSAYVYPYLTSYVFVPLARLPFDVADVVWFVLSAAAVVAGCRALGLRHPLAPAAVLLSATVVRSFQVGALNPLLFLGLALMWKHRHRTWVVAVCFTLLVGAKLFLAPMALWLVLTRPRRTWVAAGAGAAGFLALGFVLGPVSVREYLAQTRVLAEHEGAQGMSLLALVHHVLPGTAEHALPIALAAVLVALVTAVVRRAPLGRPGTGPVQLHPSADAVAFCGALVVALVLTPIFWSHYIVLALVVPLLLRPATSTALVLLPLSWLLSRPAEATERLSLPLDLRVFLLFALLVATVLAVAWRTWAGRPLAVAATEQGRDSYAAV